MADTATIVNLADRRQTRALDTTRSWADLNSTGESEATSANSRVLARGRLIENASEPQAATNLDDLYGSDTPTGGVIYNARRLLSSLDAHASQAHALYNSGDMIGADNEISLLQADLPELFCCSTLSDGLAAAVIALHHGLRNRHGSPLSLDQVYVVRKLIEKVRSDPFLNFDTSLNLVDALVAVGLRTDPQEAEEVSEFLAV